MVTFGQNVVFVLNGYIWAKVVVFAHSSSIRAKGLHLGKVVVFALSG